VIELVEKNATHFYIRNRSSQSFITQCGIKKSLGKSRINNEIKEVASIDYSPFGKEKKYRIVVTRTLKKDKQLDIFSGTSYNYYGIITNNYHYTNQELIEFYNQRGDTENSKKFLINDFNLKRLPFMDLDSNTVFMYLMAMCSILFEWIKTVLVKNKAPKINIKMRVKTVCFRYITIATTLINHAREKILKVFSEQEYKILRI
jgi:hypothetical protein